MIEDITACDFIRIKKPTQRLTANDDFKRDTTRQGPVSL